MLIKYWFLVGLTSADWAPFLFERLSLSLHLSLCLSPNSNIPKHLFSTFLSLSKISLSLSHFSTFTNLLSLTCRALFFSKSKPQIPITPFPFLNPIPSCMKAGNFFYFYFFVFNGYVFSFYCSSNSMKAWIFLKFSGYFSFWLIFSGKILGTWFVYCLFCWFAADMLILCDW